MDDDLLEHDAIASFDDYKTHLLSRATDLANSPSKYTTIPSDTQCTLKKQLGIWPILASAPNLLDFRI